MMTTDCSSKIIFLSGDKLKDKDNPVILVYRRNHTGDPDSDGIFGINDCMGTTRNSEYDAVIGIGGSQPWPDYEGLAYKINWIGIGPDRKCATQVDKGRMKRENSSFENFRGKLVTFDKFWIRDEGGPLLKCISPEIYQYMFIEHRIPRYAKNFSKEIYNELKKILVLADNAPPSPARDISIKDKYIASKYDGTNGIQKRKSCT